MHTQIHIFTHTCMMTNIYTLAFLLDQITGVSSESYPVSQDQVFWLLNPSAIFNIYEVRAQRKCLGSSPVQI